VPGIATHVRPLDQKRNAVLSQSLTGSDPTYRGLEAFEPADAAVFFGRDPDIVRGLDMLRGLATKQPPRLVVILGASGAGKSSFLRAGLWPRLERDDTHWTPLLPIRAMRGGAIEGAEGLLAVLEEVWKRFGQATNRSELRQRIETPAGFISLLRDLQVAAKRRALIEAGRAPLAVLCLDQAEELFAAETAPGEARQIEQLHRLARSAMETGDALVLVTIRSDAYGRMQTAPSLAGVHQATLSLAPVPAGEIARIIREPAEVIRRKVGKNNAPAFAPETIERLQTEIAGETDALPLLAFVLERLMRENAAAATIGIAELERTGGVAAAIAAAANGALDDAGFARQTAPHHWARIREASPPSVGGRPLRTRASTRRCWRPACQ